MRFLYILAILLLCMIVASCKSESIGSHVPKSSIEQSSPVNEPSSKLTENKIHIIESNEKQYFDVLYSPDQQKFVMTDVKYNFNTISVVQENGVSEVIFDFKQFYGESAVRDMYPLSYFWKDNESLYLINKYTDLPTVFLEINVSTKEIFQHKLPVMSYIINYDATSEFFLLTNAYYAPERNYSLYSYLTNENMLLPDLNNLVNYFQHGNKHIFAIPDPHEEYYSDKYSEVLLEGLKKVVIYELDGNETYELYFQEDKTNSSLYVYKDKPYFVFITKDILNVINYQTKEEILQLDISSFDNKSDYTFINWAVEHIELLIDLNK